MLTIITVQVAVVVAEVRPLEFAHRELRGKLEGAFTRVVFGHKALERVASDDEADFVRSVDPRGIAALRKTVGDRRRNDRIDQHEVAGSIKPSGAKGLLVDTKRKPAIPLELVAGDGLFAEFEGSSREIQQVLFHVSVVADVFDRISAKHDLEELAFFRRERLGKHFFTKEGAQAIQRFEVQRAVRQDLRKLRVDVLHVTSQVRPKSLGRVGDILNAALDQVLIPDVGIDDLQDALFKGNLCLKVGSLEGGARLLNANTRTGPAQRLKLELVLGRAHNVGSGANAAKRGVIHEGRRCQRGCRHGHFLDNRTHNVGHVGQRSTINGIDVGALTSENPGDLPDDAVYVFAGEILNRRQRDTVIGHLNEFLVPSNSLFVHSEKQQAQG